MIRRAVLMCSALLATVGATHADWTASGCFFYEDREFDETGFTGESVLPIRLADIEVVDAQRNKVLADGATDAAGCYAVFVSDNSTRTVHVRAVTRSDETPGLHIEVKRGSVGQAQRYAVATATVPNHAPSVNVDFGSALAEIGQGGEAFNIYDQMLRGAEYLARLEGAYPGAAMSLSTIWGENNGTVASYYSSGWRQIFLRDTSGYDDTVVLHEMGHYAVDLYSRSDSPGGPHAFAQCDIDLRLAFDEGFATYWGNSALRLSGVARSEIYMRSNGMPGPGNAVLVGNLETDTSFLCSGSAGEVNVFSFLWDLVDGPATPDATPGIDDAHDSLTLDDGEVWEVMTEVIPLATHISLEDFWNGWFPPPLLNGFVAEMIQIAAALDIEYREDAFEPNDEADEATAALPDGVARHGTFFRDPEGDGNGGPDLDRFAVDVFAGRPYVFETLNLWSGADTVLELFAPDGVTPLAHNDDRSAGDRSSRIDWVAPADGTYLLLVTQAPALGIHGSFDLLLRDVGPPPPDADGDGFDATIDCDDDDATIYPGATEICDGIDQDCDGLIDEDADGEDSDGDGVHNLCDNCIDVPNATQTDSDADGEGDACDLDDGKIWIRFDAPPLVRWSPDEPFDAWNSYQGDLNVLRAGGAYTQAPGENAVALRRCALDTPEAISPDLLPGEAVFYLTTGSVAGVESSLGHDSAGQERFNSNACP